MKNENRAITGERERLTVLLNRSEIRDLKHLAVDRRVLTSEIVRTVVKDFLRSRAPAIAAITSPAAINPLK
jgi:hypothetical protein